MDRIASALGDGARWRIVQLLADRPRSVGELAELTGLRQPQTTKHLQTLGRAGLVTAFPLGQRRIYAIEAAPLRDLAQRLGELVVAAEAHRDERDVLARYRAAVDAEAAAADRDRWADERMFCFERVLPATQVDVWRHWVDPALLASWWAPPSMTVLECVLDPEPGGRAALELLDAEGHYRSAGHVRLAEPSARLAFDLSVLDADGAISFTGHHDVGLAADPGGTRLRLDLRITDSTIAAAPYIAGIATGWEQVLDKLADTLTNRKDQQS